jgi:SAM-dependent methyltransferase
MQIVNVEQHQAWDGHEGEHWARHADRYERSTRRHRERLLAAADLRASDRVIDIGCGSGRTSIEAAQRAPEGTTMGLDLSGPMLAVARQRALDEAIENVTFVQGDAQVHPFEPGADVALSLTGAMFFSDPVAAFANIGSGLRPGGRLALVAWRELERNEWVSTIRSSLALGRDLPTPPPDAPTPFSLADADRVRSILGAAGYVGVALDPVDEPMELGTDADDTFEFFSHVGIVEGLLDGLDDAARAEGLDNLRTALKDAETPDGVLLGSAAWLITARRG